jgi:hypothetical protein
MQFVKLYHGYASDSCLRWSSEAIWEEETDTWDCDQESKEKVTKVVLDNHVTSADLFDFIGLSGAPTAIGKANFSLYSQNMNPPNSHSHSFAQEKIVGLGLNEYGIKMSWINSADVNQNVLRWRAVPRVKRSTTLHYTVENAGQYSSLPVPTVKSEWGSGETISLVGTIVSVSVDNGGEFVGTPLLTASYPGAFGASFSVSMSGNSVAAVNVISGGTGFNKAPSFSFSGATVVSTPSFSTLLGIADVRTESKGYDYVDFPTISLQGGSGAGGSISAITEVSNDGMVDYVRVIDGGIGYVNRSQLTFSGGGGAAVTTNVGSTVYFSAAPSGGTAPYHYLWTGASTGQSTSDYPTAFYTANYSGLQAVAVRVTDSSSPQQVINVDCPRTTALVSGSSPLTYNCTITPTPISLGATANLLVTASGGVAPYHFYLPGAPYFTVGNQSATRVTPNRQGLITYEGILEDSSGLVVRPSCSVQVN